MADAAEIPEASDPFERKVALSIAFMAVLLSIVSLKGDNAKGDGLLAATRASNSWAYFQAKSIKEHGYDLQREVMGSFSPTILEAEKSAALLSKYEKAVQRYEGEKEAIKAQAEAYERDIVSLGAIDDRCDLAGLLIQIAVVMASVSILVHWSLFWHVSLALSAVGGLLGASAFFM